MKTLPAVSVHQPWALGISHLGKTVENRGWATKYRGPVAIHATLKWDAAGEQSPLVQSSWRDRFLPADPPPAKARLVRDSLWITYGAVVAVADVVGCHLAGDFDHCSPPGDLCSPWAVDSGWHWELADVRPLRTPVPCRGAQRLWRLPPEVDAAVHAQLAPARAS